MWGVLMLGAAVAAAYVVIRGVRDGLPTVAPDGWVWPVGEGPPTPIVIAPNVRSEVERWRNDASKIAQSYPHLSTELILAVVTRESLGKDDAVGSAGEVGLMQITKGAWQDYRQATEDQTVWPWPEGIMSGYDNMRVGAWYLNRMIELTGSVREGLRAYNCGLTGAKEHPNCGVDYATFAIAAAKEFRVA